MFLSTGLRKMALRKLRSKPSSCEAGREPALSEPAASLHKEHLRRVRRRQVYEVIFSHFSEALTFFVEDPDEQSDIGTTFLCQDKKVKSS